MTEGYSYPQAAIYKARNDALEEAAKLVDEANKIGSWAYGDDIRALKEKSE